MSGSEESEEEETHHLVLHTSAAPPKPATKQRDVRTFFGDAAAQKRGREAEKAAAAQPAKSGRSSSAPPSSSGSTTRRKAPGRKAPRSNASTGDVVVKLPWRGALEFLNNANDKRSRLLWQTAGWGAPIEAVDPVFEMVKVGDVETTRLYAEGYLRFKLSKNYLEREAEESKKRSQMHKTMRPRAKLGTNTNFLQALSGPIRANFEEQQAAANEQALAADEEQFLTALHLPGKGGGGLLQREANDALGKLRARHQKEELDMREEVKNQVMSSTPEKMGKLLETLKTQTASNKAAFGEEVKKWDRLAKLYKNREAKQGSSGGRTEASSPGSGPSSSSGRKHSPTRSRSRSRSGSRSRTPGSRSRARSSPRSRIPSRMGSRYRAGSSRSRSRSRSRSHSRSKKKSSKKHKKKHKKKSKKKKKKKRRRSTCAAVPSSPLVWLWTDLCVMCDMYTGMSSCEKEESEMGALIDEL